MQTVGTWKTRSKKNFSDKTAFTAHCGLYSYVRMPFGLRNAPSTLQRTKDVAVSAVKRQFVLVYLDYNVVFSRSSEALINHDEHLLTLLCDEGAILKLKKCRFFFESFASLGNVIRHKRYAFASHKTNAIKGLHVARIVTKLTCSLGFCIVFRRVLPKFAGIACPWNDKLRED